MISQWEFVLAQILQYGLIIFMLISVRAWRILKLIPWFRTLRVEVRVWHEQPLRGEESGSSDTEGSEVSSVDTEKPSETAEIEAGREPNMDSTPSIPSQLSPASTAQESSLVVKARKLEELRKKMGSPEDEE